MPRSPRQFRGPANLSTLMHCDLTGYALAAAAAGVSILAMAQPSEAEIVYTKAHQIIGRNGSCAIDLNHDGVTDFTIHNHFLLFGSSHRSFWISNVVEAIPAPGNKVLVAREFSAGAYLPGYPIGPERRTIARQAAIAGSWGSSGGYSVGLWNNVSNRYLGFQFQIDGEIHYGWARLSVVQDRDKLLFPTELSGYAYETEPNKPIIAGDTGTVPENDVHSGATGKIFGVPQTEAKSAAALGVLALGANGLAIWRRTESLAPETTQ